MNLFSRLSEILDGDEGRVPTPGAIAGWRADSLVASMEKQEAQFCQSAVKLIAAERAVTCELEEARKEDLADEVLLERLAEEQSHALRIKSLLKQTLHQLREGIRQARSLRATVRRWQSTAAIREATASRRLFWRKYERLCDLVDERLDVLKRH